jgi:elongation factor P
MALSDLQKGKVILFQDELFLITDYSHSKRGRGGAVAQIKMKNLKSNKTTSKSFTESDKFEIAFLEERRMQFLYKENKNWVFMDNESYEQLTLPEDMLGDAAKFLKESIEVAGSFYQGGLISVEAPNFVELEVTFTEPGVRGDTVSNTLKAATVETGAEVQVPLFIEKGDLLKVDTRDGRYVERV